LEKKILWRPMWENKRVCWGIAELHRTLDPAVNFGPEALYKAAESWQLD